MPKPPLIRGGLESAECRADLLLLSSALARKYVRMANYATRCGGPRQLIWDDELADEGLAISNSPPPPAVSKSQPQAQDEQGLNLLEFLWGIGESQRRLNERHAEWRRSPRAQAWRDLADRSSPSA